MTLSWKSFLIDIPSFMDWLAATFPDKKFANSTSQFDFHVGPVPAFPGDSPNLTDSDIAKIKLYWANLDQNAEAAKRAKNSRKTKQAKTDFENQAKAHLAGKDWAAMSAAERKFAMGGSLTNDEYDSLTTS